MVLKIMQGFYFVFLWLAMFPINVQVFSKAQPDTCLSEIVSARKEVIESETFRIDKLDLGAMRVGKNKFTAVIKNKSNFPLKIGLDLRADPGLWFRKWQNQFLFELKPHEEKRMEAKYQFSRMTSEAWLRVRFGDPTIEDGRISKLIKIFEKKYYIGKANKAVNYDLSHFEKHQTEHCEIYYFKNSPAGKNITAIAAERESAFQSIASLLGVDNSRKIRIFFFPDAKSKKKETGHIGDGWAFSNNIVEVYNQKTKLDPFHELAHIISREVGNPPAIFDEGFAVYVSEKMGSDTLNYLGHARKTVDEVVRTYLEQGKLIPFEELFSYPEIGPRKSKPKISYPQAASIVKYLAETRSVARFRKAFKSLKRSRNPEIIRENKKIFEDIYGQTLLGIELAWLRKISLDQISH
ncbi:MAG: hypothetical protein E2O76_01445 [Caldithrix sp.]|nr:MAG: hypothetical protein E2O76_01445 [Caldithrix sp.]